MSQSPMEQSDSGGVAALKGFTYQNFAAAYFVLSMLRDKSLISVRCEVVDDIDLIYEDKIEYVQVKTTDGDSKWSLKEFSEATTKNVPPIGRQRVQQTVSQEDSILHKSILCDKETRAGFFIILTPRDVDNSLRYLKTPLTDRYEKEQARDLILRRLTSAVNKNRKTKTSFLSPNGHDVEYWLDHVVWNVIPNREHLELLCTKAILESAHNKGIYLSANNDPERILYSLLTNVTKKGAASRVINSVDKKSYNRNDFITWFNNEIEHYAGVNKSHVKVYTTSSKKLKSILSSFIKDKTIYTFLGDKSCTGLHGSYHQRDYDYYSITKSLHSWLPEVLLTPEEIADHTPENIINKFKSFTDRYSENISVINTLISRSLLHSTIRTEFKSQPISASLYINDKSSSYFDNIHILLQEHIPDKLIMGFSELIDTDINTSLNDIAIRFTKLISSEAFSTQKEKILTIKNDDYLLEHDIDEMLVSNKSLDDFLDRFVFAFFIGYESRILKCHRSDMEDDYLEKLKVEVIAKFKSLIEQLICENDFCKEIHMEIYLYPIPSLASLTRTFQEQGKLNGIDAIPSALHK